MGETQKIRSGGCLCGAVRYKVSGPLRDVVFCHCTMCQKLHGAAGAHTKAQKSDVAFTDESGLAWYASSDRARRGFCRICGSSLFWDLVNQPGIGILAGTLDPPAGLRTIGHIFVAEKCEFFDISDDAQQFHGSSSGTLEGDEL